MKDPKVAFVDDLIARFGERADAVKKRTMPPIAGAERRLFIKQSELDFQDFQILSEAEGDLDDGVLHLRIDLNGEK